MDFGDTSEFSHPDFTETDLPSIKTHLAQALAQLDRAVHVASNTSNGNIKALAPRLRGVRDTAHQLLNTLNRRF